MKTEPTNSFQEYVRMANLECNAPWLLDGSPADRDGRAVTRHIIYDEWQELYWEEPDGFLVLVEDRCQTAWHSCEPHRIKHVKRLIPRDMVEVEKERKVMRELIQARADDTPAEVRTD